MEAFRCPQVDEPIKYELTETGPQSDLREDVAEIKAMVKEIHTSMIFLARKAQEMGNHPLLGKLFK